MNVSETKKPNRYAALVTYLIAIVCLLLGLFLPLFGDKGILALQLPQALNSIAGKELIKSGAEFTLAYPVYFLGTAKTSFDLMALIVLLYAAITVLGLLALIPIGISVKKDKTVCALMGVIEIAAVLVLSLYVIIALQYHPETKICYNMIIALGGSALMLVLLSFMTRGKSGAAKFVLFLLSAVALLSLFNIIVLVPKLADPLLKLSDKISPLFAGDGNGTMTGISYLSLLFEGFVVEFGIPETSPAAVITYADTLKQMDAVKDKAVMVIITVVALLAVINYLLDVISLRTNGKRAGRLFNIVRYGLEILAAIALIIALLACKYHIGLLLIVLAAAALIQVAISVIRYCAARKRAAEHAHDEEEETITFIRPPKKVKKVEDDEDDEMLFNLKHIKEKKAEKPAYVETVSQNNVTDIEENDNVAEAESDASEQPANGDVHTTIEDIEVITPEQSSPTEQPEETAEVKEDETQTQTEGEKPADETAETTDEQPAQESEPVEPVPAAEEEVKPAEPVPAPAEEAKPAEPAPATAEEVKPTEPAPATAEEAKPAEPAPATAEEVKPAESAPAPAEEVKPAQTVPAQPIYIVGEKSDEFLKKLTNEEKLEFTRTFIEKCNGNIGSIPDYVIGGNNVRFFSAVFIYLGRLRALISDSLLNKMYKELNML